MNCLICDLPLIKQPLNKGSPLNKKEKKRYKKDIARENSVYECEKCKCLIKISNNDHSKTNANSQTISSPICKKCGGNYKSLSKRAIFTYHKWNVQRPYYYIVLSCPTHGSIII